MPTTKELDERHLQGPILERGPRYSTVYGYDLENGWVWAQDTEVELQELLRDGERGGEVGKRCEKPRGGTIGTTWQDPTSDTDETHQLRLRWKVAATCQPLWVTPRPLGSKENQRDPTTQHLSIW